MPEEIKSHLKSNCPQCGGDGKVLGQGTATGRLKYGCLSGHEWWGKNPAAVALGKLGGAARTASLSPEQRSRLATEAVSARWRKNKSK